jgi:hypothetical protein
LPALGSNTNNREGVLVFNIYNAQAVPARGKMNRRFIGANAKANVFHSQQREAKNLQ